MIEFTFTKQMLEEQYCTANKGFVECKNEKLLLAQVCNAAMKDLNEIAIDCHTIDELIAMDVHYSGLYNEFFHYYAGTTYGKSEEVREHVKQYGSDKNFVDKMVKHAVHYLNEMAVAA